MGYERNEKGEICCPHCNVTKNAVNTMYYHIKREHTKNFDHQCDHCEYKTYSKSILDQHVRNQHHDKITIDNVSTETMRTFSCPFCKEAPTTKGNLIQHIARNHATYISDYKTNKNCQHCTKELKSAPSYYYHCLKCIPATPELKERIEKAIK